MELSFLDAVQCDDPTVTQFEKATDRFRSAGDHSAVSLRNHYLIVGDQRMGETTQARFGQTIESKCRLSAP